MVCMQGKASRCLPCMSGDAGALSECEVKTEMTPDHTVVQVCRSVGSSRNWSVFR